MKQNTLHAYGAVARFFHWVIALLILALLLGGFIAARIPRTAESVELLKTIYSVHKTMGITVLMLAVLRIGWALTQPRPVPLHPERKLETFAAEVVHYGLYVAIILMPLAGWIMHAAEDGFAPILWPFGQGLPFVPKSEHVAKLAGAVHFYAALAIVLALAAHIGGALKHALIDRDETLARMARGISAGEAHGGASRLDRLAPVAAVVGWIAVVFFAVIIAGQGAEHDQMHAEAQVSETGGGVTGLSSDAPIWTVAEGSLGISVKQMGADVAGSFGAWSAEIAFDPDTGTGQTRVVIDTTSLTLGSVTAQAKGPEFFNTQSFAEAVFEADISPREDGDYQAIGSLTLVGQTMPVTLLFTLAIDGDTAVMEGAAELDRRDFGMGAGYPDESNVGFAVPVNVSLTATRR